MLKLSLNYVYNISQQKDNMQFTLIAHTQKVFLQSSRCQSRATPPEGPQGSSPGLSRGLFAPGTARELPGASPGQPGAVTYRSTIELATRKDPDKPANRQVESPLRRRQSPDGQQYPRLQRSQRRQRALDNTSKHQQALAININPIVTLINIS